jgi:hypothetical protein
MARPPCRPAHPQYGIRSDNVAGSGRRAAGLARLELRWPVAPDQLPTPGRPRRPGLPNLRDATGAVEALVEQVNATCGPVLAELEAPQR